MVVVVVFVVVVVRVMVEMVVVVVVVTVASSAANPIGLPPLSPRTQTEHVLRQRCFMYEK